MQETANIEPYESCYLQTTAPKNTWYLRNDKISKIGKLAIDPKAIALAKWSSGSNIKIVKNVPETTLEPH